MGRHIESSIEVDLLESVSPAEARVGKDLSALWARLNTETPLRPIEAATDRQPTTLCSWSIHRVEFLDGSCGSHLVGIADGELRITTAVQSINKHTRQITTQSGRVYVLDKNSSYLVHAAYLFEVWQMKAGAIRAHNQTLKLLYMLRDRIPLRAKSRLADLDTGDEEYAVKETLNLDTSQTIFRDLRVWERV
jgi:hypothetical protein